MADNILVSKDSSGVIDGTGKFDNIELQASKPLISTSSSGASIELEPANNYVNVYAGGQRYIFTNQRFTVPSTDTGTIELGNSSARWDTIYGQQLNLSGGDSFNVSMNDILSMKHEASFQSTWLIVWKSNYPSTNSNACIMRCDGDLINQDGTYGQISDEKFKENIVDAKSQWNDIKCLRFRNFNLKTNPDKKLLGLVAQEVQEHCPYLIQEEYDENKDETFLSLKQSILYMKTAKCLQEALERIEQLEAKVEELQKKKNNVIL